MDFLHGWLARRAAPHYRRWLLRPPRNVGSIFASIIVAADAICAARCNERILVRRRVEGHLSDSLVGLSASSAYRFGALRVRPYGVPPKKDDRYPRPQMPTR